MEGSQPSAAGGDGAPTATRTQAAIVLTGQKVTLARATPWPAGAPEPAPAGASSTKVVNTYSEYVFTRIIRVFEPWLNTRLNTVYS